MVGNFGINEQLGGICMPRNKFSPEFKSQAVKLVKEQGLSVKQAAHDLGIGQSTLDKWIKLERLKASGAPEITESELTELKKLRKENHTLRMERDILKKAAAYFANQS
jgi:transposase